MPVTSTFNSAKYEESIEAILQEFLVDYFAAASYTITFQPPSEPAKPTLWLQMMPGQNREARTSDGKGKWVQGKRVMFLVSMLSKARADAVTMADRLTGAVLASSSALGSAGLRYAELSPVQDIIVESQPQRFRRAAALNFVVEVRA